MTQHEPMNIAGSEGADAGMRRPRAFGALPGVSSWGDGRFGPLLDSPGPGGQGPYERPRRGQRPVRPHSRVVQAAPCAQHRRRLEHVLGRHSSLGRVLRPHVRGACGVRGARARPYQLARAYRAGACHRRGDRQSPSIVSPWATWWTSSTSALWISLCSTSPISV